MYCKILISDPKLAQKQVAAEIWKNFTGVCQIWKTAEVVPTQAAVSYLSIFLILCLTPFSSQNKIEIFFVKDYFTK